MSVPIFESSPDNFDAEDAYREAEYQAAYEAHFRDEQESQYAALNPVAYVCQHCGWAVTREALEMNGGVPYCCRSAERDYAG